MQQEILLKTDRLSIRRMERKDRETFFHYRSIPEVYRFQSWRPETIEEVDAFLEKNEQIVPLMPDEWLQLAVCLRDGTLIGDIGLHFLIPFQLELGYTLAPAHQGNGYATEAVRAVLVSTFGEWDIHRITASVDPENLPSVRLLERLGFRKEAHFIASFRANGEWRDDCVYAMLRAEWLSR